jgi:hypothetical protein
LRTMQAVEPLRQEEPGRRRMSELLLEDGQRRAD